LLGGVNFWEVWVAIRHHGLSHRHRGAATAVSVAPCALSAEYWTRNTGQVDTEYWTGTAPVLGILDRHLKAEYLSGILDRHRISKCVICIDTNSSGQALFPYDGVHDSKAGLHPCG